MERELVSEDGYVLHKNAISVEKINQLLGIFQEWEQSSRPEKNNFGDAPFGKNRFGIGHGHTFQNPRLVRVNNPCDISAEFNTFINSDAVLQIAKHYLGDTVRFHHCKINTKYVGTNETIHLHQDFCFDPHTNKSLITMMIPLVNIQENNGPLLIVPKSQDALISHFQDGEFAGKIPNGWKQYEDHLIEVLMDRGDILVSDGSLIHGSKGNSTKRPRPALFMELTSGDALPLAPYHVPSKFSGKIVSGDPNAINIRLEKMLLQVPNAYEQSSIFSLQDGK